MPRYKIIYTRLTIEGVVATDNMMFVEEIVESIEERNHRLQQLIDEGQSPVYRKIDEYENIVD